MNALEAYAVGLSSKTPDEREVLRQRNEVIAASPDAPGWLQLVAAWTLAALTSLDVGGDPALAATEALISSEAELAAVEDALQKLVAYGRFDGLSKLFASEDVDALTAQQPGRACGDPGGAAEGLRDAPANGRRDA